MDYHAFPHALPHAILITSACHAGQRRARPHMSIRGVTEKPQVPYSAKPDARKLRLSVALLPSINKVLVQPFSGTTYAKYRAKKEYHTKKGAKAESLTSEEYVDILARIKRVLRRSHRNKKRHAYLIHDRDPAHLTEEAAQEVEGTGIQLMTLPPRSPDLDPLNYAVFAHSKTWLKRQNLPDWDNRCEIYIEHLKHLDPVTQTAGYRARLKKVIAAKGGHIED